MSFPLIIFSMIAYFPLKPQRNKILDKKIATGRQEVVERWASMITAQ
jgi:hypothetical protein